MRTSYLCDLWSLMITKRTMYGVPETVCTYIKCDSNSAYINRGMEKASDRMW